MATMNDHEFSQINATSPQQPGSLFRLTRFPNGKSIFETMPWRRRSPDESSGWAVDHGYDDGPSPSSVSSLERSREPDIALLRLEDGLYRGCSYGANPHEGNVISKDKLTDVLDVDTYLWSESITRSH